MTSLSLLDGRTVGGIPRNATFHLAAHGVRRQTRSSEKEMQFYLVPHVVSNGITQDDSIKAERLSINCIKGLQTENNCA